MEKKSGSSKFKPDLSMNISPAINFTRKLLNIFILEHSIFKTKQLHIRSLQNMFVAKSGFTPTTGGK